MAMSPNQMNGNNHEQNGYHHNEQINDIDDDHDHESLSEFLIKLHDIHREDIYELSRENGYSLSDRNKFNKWILRSSLMKLVRIPSDSKIFELLSLRLNNNSRNRMNQNNPSNNEMDDSFLSQIVYYYLNIQINDNQCIHCRIYSKNGKTEVQAILYKEIQDKLRQF